MYIEEQKVPSTLAKGFLIFRHSCIRGRNENLALEISGWEAFSPVFECASKSYKVNGVFTVNIMDVVGLVCLFIFNLWFSSSNSSRSS